jgi:hypothetical protein
MNVTGKKLTALPLDKKGYPIHRKSKYEDLNRKGSLIYLIKVIDLVEPIQKVGNWSFGSRC